MFGKLVRKSEAALLQSLEISAQAPLPCYKQTSKLRRYRDAWKCTLREQ